MKAYERMLKYIAIKTPSNDASETPHWSFIPNALDDDAAVTMMHQNTTRMYGELTKK